MSLRLRLFLVLAALFAGVGLLSLWGLRLLTLDLGEALAESAEDVGRAVVTVLRTDRLEWIGESEDAARHAEIKVEVDGEGRRRVRHLVDGREVEREDFDAVRETIGTPTFVHGFRFDREGDALVLSGAGERRTIEVPQTGVSTALARFRNQLAVGGAALLLLALLAVALLAHRVAAPMRGLADAARRLGTGERGVQADAPSTVPEIRASVEAFNGMSSRLAMLEAEAERLRADRELSELGEIGRGLAHSLRNPLNTLGLSLEELARRQPRDGDAEALAVRGREAIARIDQALRGFLALAAGDAAPAEAVDVRTIAEDVLLEATQRAAGRVRLRLDAPQAVRLRALAAELRILIHTLVINALEASPDGGEVVVRLRSGAPLTIEVTDRGSGVPAQLRARLFSPHVSSKPDGAGMGLFLAERLASRRYRGRITLEDIDGGGTLARLTLEDRVHG